MAVVTISREAGSGGDEVARRVSRILGYRYLDKTLMARVAREQGISESEVVDYSEDNYRRRGLLASLLSRSAGIPAVTAIRATARDTGTRDRWTLDEQSAVGLVAFAVQELAKRGNVVIVGRGGQAILRDSPGVVHVRIVAAVFDRVQRLVETEGLTHEAAVRSVGERDRAAAQYLRRFHDIDWSDPMLYDMTLNVSRLGEERSTGLIVAAARQLEGGVGENLARSE